MVDKLILLVDDNEHDVFFTQRALKKSAIASRVTVARDGEEALDYLFGRGKYAGRDLSDMPVVILLDLKMPRVDGLEVLEQLRANDMTRYVPIVVLTASKEDADRSRSYARGCNAYVTKPVDFDQFAEAVQQICGFWLQLNEVPPRVHGAS